jgi:hypothetical protein
MQQLSSLGKCLSKDLSPETWGAFKDYSMEGEAQKYYLVPPRRHRHVRAILRRREDDGNL